MLIATPLLKWYLMKGFKVSRVYQAVEYKPVRCFKGFEKEVSAARRAGDLDPDKSIIADTMKLLGNSAYGSMILDKTRHRRVLYVKGASKAKLKVNEPSFVSLTELGTDRFEIQMKKKTLNLDLPISIGCLDKYVSRDNFELTQMDTDSMYMALGTNDLQSAIRPEKLEEFKKLVEGSCHCDEIEGDDDHWFPRTCCKKHAQFDRRTPGLFKLEAEGDEMICLASKTYILQNPRSRKEPVEVVGELDGESNQLLKDEIKFSCKGINKSRLLKLTEDPMAMYKSVLESGTSYSSENAGFRCRNGNMWTYRQERSGFGYFYCKRQVLDCGVRTIPLNLMLNPWPSNNYEMADCIHPLGLMHNWVCTKNGIKFHSMIHMFMYEKAKFHSKSGRFPQVIAKLKTPSDVAKVGSKIKTDTQWYNVQDGVMESIMRLKIRKDDQITILLDIIKGKNIVYIDKFDKYWGCGLNQRIAEQTEANQFPGQNRLGELWKKVINDNDLYLTSDDEDDDEI